MSTIKSVEKTLHILTLFDMNRKSLSISEVQRETGYPKSTIFRLFATMEKMNFIHQNPVTQRYHLGFQFFRLGSIVQSEFDFRKVALPVMERLAKETNETVELNITDGVHRICIEKVDSPMEVRNVVQVGDRKPLHLGSSGKVLLAFLDESERDVIIQQLVDNKEVDDVGALLEDLRNIRRDHYKVTREERVAGSFSISTPIFDSNKKMIASLTIAGPIQRLTEEHERRLLQSIRSAAREINNHLGYFDT